MATQSSLQRLARRAILTAAKADTGVTDLIPAGAIAPLGEPVWPFADLRAPVTRKLRMACVRGAEVAFTLSAFARQRMQEGVVVETAYDHASRIGSALEKALDERKLTLENGAICSVSLSDTNLLRDEDPNAYHWFSQVNCRVLSE